MWTSDVQKVNAIGAVYIRADGSIDPSGSPISTFDHMTYFLTGNISSSLIVERNNITVDGAGKAIHGSGSGIAVNLTERFNVTIKNLRIDGFVYGIWLNVSSHSVLSENSITNTTYSISLAPSSSNNRIIGNEIRRNVHGIGLDNCSNCLVKGNRISNSWDGISLIVTADDNEISQNDIADCYYSNGIQILSSSGNKVHENNVTASNHCGISIESSADNIMTENNIISNHYGIGLTASSDNVIFHNNFFNNRQHVLISGPSSNSWNDSYPSGGNYWSNFTSVDADSDGIGDSQYYVDAGNVDGLPLMGMFSSFNASLGYTVNVVSNSTIERFEYSKNNGSIRMNVSNMSSLQSFGFCRLCIPRELMLGPYSVVIDQGSTPVLTFNDVLYDNGTHRWICFAYQHTQHEVVVIPEFVSLSVVHWLAIAMSASSVVILLKKGHGPDSATRQLDA